MFLLGSLAPLLFSSGSYFAPLCHSLIPPAPPPHNPYFILSSISPPPVSLLLPVRLPLPAQSIRLPPSLPPPSPLPLTAAISALLCERAPK